MRWSAEQKEVYQKRNEAVAQLYRSGKTMTQCGASFGIHKERVRQILVRQGVTERRFWAKAQPKPEPTPKLTLKEKIKIKEVKFWSQAAITADAEKCWIWQGNMYPRGYGRTSWYGKTYYARHIALLIYKGSMPPRYVLDSCGTKLCVNPHHLTASTTKERL